MSLAQCVLIEVIILCVYAYGNYTCLILVEIKMLKVKGTS